MTELVADFQVVAVVGPGSQAVSLSELVAASGREVIVIDGDRPRIDGGDLASADLVIEARSESADVTGALLAAVAAVVGPQVPIITTTAILSVTALAALTPNPERVAGLHFFPPVSESSAVEVVQALQSDEELIDRLAALVDDLGKTPIVVKDRPGFLIDAMALPYFNDVIRELDDGLATAEDIDIALELGLGYRTGPLKMLDEVGLDEHLRKTEAIHAATSDPRYAVPPLLRQMVAAGHLGDKNNRGFRAPRTA